MQRLRDLIPLPRRRAPKNAVSEMREWLESTSDLPEFQAMRALALRIPEIAQQRNLHMRSKLLEEVRGEAEKILPQAEKEVDGAALPLSAEVAKVALAADNLLKILSLAYLGIATRIQTQRLGEGLSRRLEDTLRRAMQMVLRRQLLAYRAYATPSPSSWQMLHNLFGMAREHGLDTHGGREMPVAHLYLTALLTAFIEPNRFPRGHLEKIHDLITHLAPLAVIGEVTPEIHAGSMLGQFVVHLHEGAPGQPLLRIPAGVPTADKLLLDFRPSLTVIDRCLRAEKHDSTPPLDAPEPLLRALRSAIGNQAARRFGRTHFRPRADLVAGLEGIVAFMEGIAPGRRFDDSERLLAATSEWALVDESPGGFGLRYLKGDKHRVEAGDIIGLQPRENSQFHICIIRRIASRHGRLEIGVQTLAAQGMVVRLTSKADGAPLNALLLPLLPGFGKAPGLLAPPGKVFVDDFVSFDTERLRVEKRIETNERIEFFTLQRLA